MDQRAQTILKVAGELILQQEDFFNYGVEYLKPLALKDIAAVIGMHESTVSRVTTNKYIGTPRGVFELKYFFSGGVSSADGTAAYSSEAVKARLKTLLDAETPDAILSDDDLVAALGREGIEIARRTVAKYREAMKIPSSVQRRRQKNPA
jgi:RNA polymerase sigma-54 factor